MSQSELRIFTRFVCIVCLSVYLYCIKSHFTHKSQFYFTMFALPMSVYLYCQCQSICLVCLYVWSYCLFYLYFQCWSICIFNVSLSNLFFLNVMSVYLSCLSICIFSLSAWLVHGFKRVMVKSHWALTLEPIFNPLNEFYPICYFTFFGSNIYFKF